MASTKTEWELSADASKMLKALESVMGAMKGMKTGTGTAEKALEDFKQGMGKLAQEAQNLAKSFGETQEKIGAFGDTAGDIDSILMGMTGVLEKIDPQLATVATNAADMAAGIESVSRALAMASPQMIAITAVALALGTAYTHFTEKTEASAAAQKAAKERSKDLRKEYAKLENAVFSIGLEWAVYTEALTETEAEEKRVTRALKQSASGALEEYAKAVKDTSDAVNKAFVLQWKMTLAREADIEKNKEQGMSEFSLQQIREMHNRKIGKQNELVAQLTQTQTEAVEGQKTAKDLLDETISRKMILIRASAEEADANTETADTVDTVADAYKFLAEKMTAALLASGGMAETIKDLTDRAIGPNQSASDQLTMKYDDMTRAMVALKEESERRIKVLKAEIEEAKTNEVTTEELVEAEKALANEMKNVSDAGEALLTIEAALRIAQMNLSYDMAETAEVIEEDLGPGIKKLTDDMDDMLTVLDSAGKMSTAFGDLFSSAIELSMMQSDKLTEKQREQLWVLYEMQKAAAMTSIVIDTASAIVSAYAWAGPLYPIAAAAIAAGGAMQLGIVSSTPPPFHVGGIVPDGSGLVAALPGEAFLNRQATANLGADGVAALNSGGGAGGMVIQNVYGHRVFDRFVIDNISKGGPLNSAIKGNTRVGHRKRSTV